MDLNEAITVIDDLVFAKEGRRLDEAEMIVIEAAWEDKEYKEMAPGSPYSLDILQRRVAPKLWFLLTGIFGNGEKVTKKRLRGILEQRKFTPDSHSRLGISNKSLSDTSKPTLPVIKGQPPKIFKFYGRGDELTELRKLIVDNRCVALFGSVGIGKSTLVAKLINDIAIDPQSEFDYLVWESVYSGPSLQSLLTNLLKLLAPQDVTGQELPRSVQDKISALIEFLQSRRCLLVLDGAEAWLQGDRNKSFNPYGEQYAEYGGFFRRIVDEQHQSCLVLTSREPFIDIAKLKRSHRPSYSYKIEGLDLEAAKGILRDLGLADEHRWSDFLEPYLGNPAFIELVATRVKDFFGGRVAEFLKYKTALVNEIFREILSQEFCKPSLFTYLEKIILLHLIERVVDFKEQQISFTALVDEINGLEKKPVSISDFIEAIEGLHDRSLIVVKKNQLNGELCLNLQPVIEKLVLKDQGKMLSSFLQILKSPKNSAGFDPVGSVL